MDPDAEQSPDSSTPSCRKQQVQGAAGRYLGGAGGRLEEPEPAGLEEKLHSDRKTTAAKQKWSREGTTLGRTKLDCLTL